MLRPGSVGLETEENGTVTRSAVIFDLGQVVLRWVPERAFEHLMDAEEIAAFFERVEFHAWNQANDVNDELAAAEAAWIARFPSDAARMQEYRPNFERTITDMVPGTAAIIAELQQAGVRVSALTNWSGELFVGTRARWGILNRFSDIVVSGKEGIAKPDQRIFEIACERAGLAPAEAVFVDDSGANIEAAKAFGLHAVQFTTAEQFRADLVELGLLAPRVPVTQPIYHWTSRSVWTEALNTGVYPWSARDRSYEAEGFVHFSFADQVEATRRKFYADLADPVLLRLTPAPTDPVVVESTYPHLFAPLPLLRVTEISPELVDRDATTRQK